jgi:hypothetical protein
LETQRHIFEPIRERSSIALTCFSFVSTTSGIFTSPQSLYATAVLEWWRYVASIALIE